MSCIVGLALFYAWNLVDIYGSPVISPYERVEHLASSTFASSLTNTLSYILIAVCFSRLRCFSLISLAGALVTGGGVIAAYAFSMLGALSPSEAVALYKTIGRICAGCVIVAWGMKYSQLDGQSITVYALAGFLVASLLCLIINALPLPWGALCFAALLPISATLLLTSPSPERQSNPPLVQESHGRRAFVALVWRTMTVLALFGIVTWTVILGAQSRVDQGPDLGLFTPLGCLATVSILLAVSLTSGGMFTVSYVYKLVIPFIGIGLLCIATLNFASAMGPTLVSVGYTCLDLFCFVMIADSCGKTGTRAGTAFGWCRAIESSLPLFAVLIMRTARGDFDLDESAFVLLLGTASATIILASVVLDRRGIFSSSHLNPTINYPKAEILLFTLQCEKAIEDFGLTAREAEVLSLIVRGRSVPHIAERLAISRSTVKTHIERIYQKFGVNERQEMIDRIEAIELDREDGTAR